MRSCMEFLSSVALWKVLELKKRSALPWRLLWNNRAGGVLEEVLQSEFDLEVGLQTAPGFAIDLPEYFELV